MMRIWRSSGTTASQKILKGGKSDLTKLLLNLQKDVYHIRVKMQASSLGNDFFAYCTFLSTQLNLFCIYLTGAAISSLSQYLSTMIKYLVDN